MSRICLRTPRKLEQGQWSERGRGRDSRALDDGIGLDINSWVYGLDELNTIKDLAGKADRVGRAFWVFCRGSCGLPLNYRRLCWTLRGIEEQMDVKTKGFDVIIQGEDPKDILE